MEGYCTSGKINDRFRGPHAVGGTAKGGVYMTYQPVAKTTDIPSGTMKSVVAGGKKLLLANVDGAFYAMQQRCPHLGGNLSRGKLQGKTVTCPLHKATFDLASGEVIDVAHLLFLKFKTKQAATYPVKIDGDAVMVDA